MKLALGTVQFGLPYGIANQSGQIQQGEISNILSFAENNGINTLDTAVSYGESEQRLGQVGIDKWQVISKLPVVPRSSKSVFSWIDKVVDDSLKRLKVSSLSGLLIHQPQQLLGNKGSDIFNALTRLKEQGKIEKTGISIYSPADLDSIWSHYQFDLVQAPYNIFDRRIATSGWLEKLNRHGIEVHVRSIFLQGLLLMEPTERPARFEQWKSHWDQWDWWLKEQKITALEACLAFALNNSNIDRVLVGIDSLKQFQEILQACQKQELVFPEILEIEDLQLLNPVNWLD